MASLRSALGRGGFGAAQQPFAEGELVGGRHARARRFSSAFAAAWLPMLPKDLAAAWATSLSGVVQQLGQELDGLGVAAHADAADDADQQPALELARRVAQGLVHRGTRDGLQPVAGHVGELLVRQERGQRGDGLFVADARQLTAGVGFLLLGGIGFQDGDQLLDLFGGRGLGAGSERGAGTGEEQRGE